MSRPQPDISPLLARLISTTAMDLHLWRGAHAMTLETSKTVIITGHFHTIITIIVIISLHLGTSVIATAAGPPPGTAPTTAIGPPMTEDDGHTRDADSI